MRSPLGRGADVRSWRLGLFIRPDREGGLLLDRVAAAEPSEPQQGRADHDEIHEQQKRCERVRRRGRERPGGDVEPHRHRGAGLASAQELADHEVIHRPDHREERGAEQRRHQQRHQHPTRRAQRGGPQVGRGLFVRRADQHESCLDDQHDDGQHEDHVAEQLRGRPERDRVVELADREEEPYRQDDLGIASGNRTRTLPADRTHFVQRVRPIARPSPSGTVISVVSAASRSV